ncbi:hypothetical protein OPIT5_01635 [Opitutaceae bacterium TAV5]|nr:hypothetical protein OPIT5_01635 [Opitutaceae bacterium TAV5]
MTLWVYRGGDSVLAVTIEAAPPEPSQFITSKRIFDLKTERNDIPKALLESIEKKPNKAMQPTPVGG